MELLRAYINGGTNYRGVYREEDFAHSEDALDEDLYPEDDVLDENDESESHAAYHDGNLPQDEADDLTVEYLGAFGEEDTPVQALETHTEESYSYEGDANYQDDWDGIWDEAE